ncbi:MAG: hypothetical protein COU33_04750 [Candidatus Magasanikbacteria bacterium CG10_big_fil_rev_8_21_14_0_10_43_6]|uniref:Uncharacterized protein n=1 Tax=Candidatus Magasanikbacteria bacterium CG10_big_fil_rev_8_21_14_0_10_43_6 TaxID=1974650 RepID=A0A2M6W0B3_9BACT|nr:MAG: hypothetical protein COU33_04750 [Candidatus Magasanikbacteria bacterium CG10_big_fil_rev_8_21_14_0_10_43_6]
MHVSSIKKIFSYLFIFFALGLSVLSTTQVSAVGYGGADFRASQQADEAVKRLEEQRKQAAIAAAQAKDQGLREECDRRLVQTSPQCANIEDLIEGPPGETVEQQTEREELLASCNQAFTSCMSVNDNAGNFSDAENDCRKKRAVYNNGACASPATIGSNACIDFYNSCLKDAEWDQQAIAEALGSAGEAGGTAGGYPVRMTIEEYNKLNTPIPYCAFTYEGCRDADDLVTLMVNIGKMIFSVIGMLAFVMFIYGGFTMILAMGNPEKFKKGMQILVAAVVGIVISLSAYLLINFILDALGVGAGFRAL